MWPDDDRLVRVDLRGDDPLPLDPELAALDTLLAAAGSRAAARTATDDRPTRRFAADLRSRLIGDTGRAVSPGAGLAAAWGVEVAPADGPYVVTSRPVAAATGRVRRQPTIAPVSRWTAVAMAAALVLSVVALGPRVLLGGPTEARVTSAVGATLERAGATLPARARDRTPGPAIGSSRTRPAARRWPSRVARRGSPEERIPGSTAWIAMASSSSSSRVASGTASVERSVTTPSPPPTQWTATGTAFDLDRGPRPVVAGGPRGGIEHTVRVTAPRWHGRHAGSVGIVDLGRESAGPRWYRAGGRGGLDGPWLVENARATSPSATTRDHRRHLGREPRAERRAHAGAGSDVDDRACGPVSDTDDARGRADADASPDASADATPRPTQSPRPSQRHAPRRSRRQAHAEAHTKPTPKPEPTPEPTPASLPWAST